MLRDVGRLPRGQLHEVQRSDLVAGYVGQTAQKTKTEIEKASAAMGDKDKFVWSPPED